MPMNQFDQDKFNFWEQFNDQRRSAVVAVAKGGCAQLRTFIKRCEELDMPITAGVLRAHLVDNPYKNPAQGFAKEREES